MRIQAPPPRREVKELQSHSHHNPGDHQSRPRRPHPPRLPILLDTEPSPQRILSNPQHNIRRHVVRIIPSIPLQIRDMHREQPNTKPRPSPQERLRFLSPLIQPKYADRRIIKPIQHTRAGPKIVHLLRNTEIPRMENHAEDPARHAEVREADVVFSKGVGGGDVGVYFLEAVLVREEVEEGEEDGEGFLHAEEAVEGPFAVELDNWLRRSDALVGDYVLAGVVAF